MTGTNDPYQRGSAGSSEPAGSYSEWSATGAADQPLGYPPSDYPEYPIGYNPHWPPPNPYDGVPQGYAVTPSYPGIPGQGPLGPQKSSKRWMVFAGAAVLVVIVLAVALVLITRDNAPRQSPLASTTSSPAPELPTVSDAPTPMLPPGELPTPTGPSSTLEPTPTAAPGPPKAPGQVLAVGDCLALTPPVGYQPLDCASPQAVYKVFDVISGGTCKSGQTGFTAGNFSYCITPQLVNGSCYLPTKVMGAAVLVAANSCQQKGAFQLVLQLPGTRDAKQCVDKPGVVHAFIFNDPALVICTSEFAQ